MSTSIGRFSETMGSTEAYIAAWETRIKAAQEELETAKAKVTANPRLGEGPINAAQELLDRATEGYNDFLSKSKQGAAGQDKPEAV